MSVREWNSDYPPPYYIEIWKEIRDDFLPLWFHKDDPTSPGVDGKRRLFVRPGVLIDPSIFSRRWAKWVDRLSELSDKDFETIRFIARTNLDLNLTRVKFSWGYIAACIAAAAFFNTIMPLDIQSFLEDGGFIIDIFGISILFLIVFGIITGLMRLPAQDLVNCIEFAALHRQHGVEPKDKVNRVGISTRSASSFLASADE